MPIPTDRLATALEKNLAPVYLVAGDEPLLIQESSDAIRKAARASGCDEREVLHVEPGFDWQSLLSAGASMSLFSQRRLIELHLGTKGAGREGSATIKDYCANPPEDIVLLIHGGSMDRRGRETAWVKAIESVGAFVYAWPVAAQQLPDWVATRLQQAGLSAVAEIHELAQLIAQRNEGNLLGAAQEIEKLSLLYATVDGHVPASLTTDVLQAAINDGARFGSFDLVDKILVGDRAGALRSLYRLREEGEDPLAILGALGWSIRCLARLALAEGRAREGVSKELKLFGDRRSTYQRAASRLGPHQMQRALQRIARVDRAAKGSFSARGREPWNELIELVLCLLPPQRRRA